MFKLDKGQVFTADLVASIAVFSIFLGAFGLIWNISIDKFDNTNNPENIGGYTFSSLTSSGFPENWKASNVEILGLYSDGLLNTTKVSDIRNIPRSDLKRLLRSQEFLLKLEYLNESVVTRGGSPLRYNTSPIPSKKSVYVYRDIGVTAQTQKRVILEFMRWKG